MVKEQETVSQTVAEKPVGKVHTERKPKMSFKERKEYEALSAEIESLTSEKEDIEKKFSEGTGDISSLSVRYSEVKDLLDEKELRWLELSELE